MAISNEIDQVPALTRGPRRFQCRNFTGSQETVVSYESSFFDAASYRGSREVISEKNENLNTTKILIGKSIVLGLLITLVITSISISKKEVTEILTGESECQVQKWTTENVCKTFFSNSKGVIEFMGGKQGFLEKTCNNGTNFYRDITLETAKSQFVNLLDACREKLLPFYGPETLRSYVVSLKMSPSNFGLSDEHESAIISIIPNLTNITVLSNIYSMEQHLEL